MTDQSRDDLAARARIAMDALADSMAGSNVRPFALAVSSIVARMFCVLSVGAGRLIDEEGFLCRPDGSLTEFGSALRSFCHDALAEGIEDCRRAGAADDATTDGRLAVLRAIVGGGADA